MHWAFHLHTHLFTPRVLLCCCCMSLTAVFCLVFVSVFSLFSFPSSANWRWQTAAPPWSRFCWTSLLVPRPLPVLCKLIWTDKNWHSQKYENGRPWTQRYWFLLCAFMSKFAVRLTLGANTYSEFFVKPMKCCHVLNAVVQVSRLCLLTDSNDFNGILLMLTISLNEDIHHTLAVIPPPRCWGRSATTCLVNYRCCSGCFAVTSVE